MEEKSKATLHLELTLETGAIRCELPNNFVIALGAIQEALRGLTGGGYFQGLPADGKVVVHLEFDVLNVRDASSTEGGYPHAQITGSRIIAKGLLHYAREMIMERLVRPSLKSKIEVVSPGSIGTR